MSKIRKLYYFDKKNMQEMISGLNNYASDNYINHIMFNPLLPFHHLLPLSFKFLPESYLLKDKKQCKGLITVAPIKSLQKKVEIKKLFFEENSYEDAAELVQYVTSRYKAMGAVSVLTKVDDYMPELLSMFISRCGYSKISFEKIWRITEFPTYDYDKREFRSFRNSDAKTIASIYNDSLIPHIRPLLSKEPAEFKDSLFRGLAYYSEYKYIIEDKKTRNINGYISIMTSDNQNYIVDIVQKSWVELDINAILSFISDKIRRRNKKFGFFIRSKNYVSHNDRYEKVFMGNGYECVQNQVILTNSSARVLRTEETTGKYTILSDFCPSNPVSI